MKPAGDRFTVFVVCDSPTHAKAQAVTNFVRVRAEDEGEHLPGQHWDEVYPGRRKSGTDSAVTLVDNAHPDTSNLAGLDTEYWARARAVYELECRKCHKSHQWKLERLFPILDRIHEKYRESHGETGVYTATLRLLAASMDSLPRAAPGHDTSE